MNDERCMNDNLEDNGVKCLAKKYFITSLTQTLMTPNDYTRPKH